MLVKTVIYEPPEEGLPHLVIAFETDGLKVTIANTPFEARTMVSERVIRRRRERKTEGSMAFPSRPA
jgi:hypothetical protein